MKPQIKLFREIQAVIRKYLPKQTQDYYKSHCKENFYTFSDEADPQRVRDLMVRAEEHVRWVLKKVSASPFNPVVIPSILSSFTSKPGPVPSVIVNYSFRVFISLRFNKREYNKRIRHEHWEVLRGRSLNLFVCPAFVRTICLG
jgi:hypothetical protein